MWLSELVRFMRRVAKIWKGKNTDTCLGPAHAVYFATYEAVKHVMGGNQAGVHHPLAAGKSKTYLHYALINDIDFTQPPAELAQLSRAML